MPRPTQSNTNSTKEREEEKFIHHYIGDIGSIDLINKNRDTYFFPRAGILITTTIEVLKVKKKTFAGTEGQRGTAARKDINPYV